MTSLDAWQGWYDNLMPPEEPEIDECEALTWFLNVRRHGIEMFAEAFNVSVDYVKNKYIGTILTEFKDALDDNYDFVSNAIQEYIDYIDTHKPNEDWY